MSSLLSFGSYSRNGSGVRHLEVNMFSRGASLLSRSVVGGSKNAQSQIAKAPDAEQYFRCNGTIHWSVVQGSLQENQMRSEMENYELVAFVPSVDWRKEKRVPDELANNAGAPLLAWLPKGGE